ncbi:MAG: AraC family transcriptional regulator [Verrucomicrobia bacterium]|nr:AraC family transcriptional regulator [Verrucomicrobiota bacterium]
MNGAGINLNVSGIKATFTINQAVVRLSATHPLNVEQVAVVSDIAPHDHDYYEVSIVVRGRCRHHTADGMQELAPGSVIVVAPGGVHAFSRPRGVEFINLYYLAEWVAVGWREQWAERGLVPLFLAQLLFRRDERPRPAVFRLEAGEAAAVTGELDDIRRELGSARPSPLFIKAAFLKLLVRLSRAGETSGAEFSAAVWAVLHGIEAAIENGRPFDHAAQLRAWPVTADHGSRLFRRATGLSPLEYYQRRRVHHACARLLGRDRTVTEVAMELGFADAAHFSRLFRKYAGLTPRAYRLKYTTME